MDIQLTATEQQILREFVTRRQQSLESAKRDEESIKAVMMTIVGRSGEDTSSTYQMNENLTALVMKEN